MRTTLLFLVIWLLVHQCAAVPGCSQFSCDSSLSNVLQKQPPLSQPKLAWRKIVGELSNSVGCASDGEQIIVCTAKNSTNSIMAFNSSGKELWSSNVLKEEASENVPLFVFGGRANGIILTDGDSVVKMVPNSGNVIYQNPVPVAKGSYASPSYTSHGFVITVSSGGPISTNDDWGQGECNAVLWLNTTCEGIPGRFVGRGTPSIEDERLYLLTSFLPLDGSNRFNDHHRLYAIDARRAMSERLFVVWHFDFKGDPQTFQASIPHILIEETIFFPSYDSSTTFLHAVKDHSDSPREVWKKALPVTLPVNSFARNDNNSFWVSFIGSPEILLISTSGDIIQKLDVGLLFPTKQTIGLTSPITMSGVNPSVMLMGLAFGSQENLSYSAVAVHPEGPKLLWEFPLLKFGATGQFVIVGNGATTTTVFTTAEGIWAIS